MADTPATSGQAFDPWRTAISDADDVSLRYRGYDVTRLMATASFADTLFLLHQSRLPTEGERRLVDAILIAAADHGPGSPSAAAARLVASGNRRAPEAAVGAGVLAMGDEHAGAGEACMTLIEASVRRAQEEGRGLADVAAGGVLAAMVLTQLLYKKIDLTFVLNGAIAGLVSITAEPLAPSPGAAVLIGAVGGVIVVLAVPMLDKLRIDDVVGAIPAHLLAGIWGTMAVPLNNADTAFGTQFIGVAAIGAFTFIVSLAVWGILKATVGIRLSDEAEEAGIDQSELGMEAYPEFGPSMAN
jgi:Amt family ammonium transporter